MRAIASVLPSHYRAVMPVCRAPCCGPVPRRRGRCCQRAVPSIANSSMRSSSSSVISRSSSVAMFCSSCETEDAPHQHRADLSVTQRPGQRQLGEALAAVVGDL